MHKVDWNYEVAICGWGLQTKGLTTLKSPKSPYFFHFWEKRKSFLNRTLGLRKSFFNQTTYVLKKSFINRDSFLNRAFLNQERMCICRIVDMYYKFNIQPNDS